MTDEGAAPAEPTQAPDADEALENLDSVQTEPSRTTPDADVAEKAICFGCDSGCTRVGPASCRSCCSCNGHIGAWGQSAFNPNVWLCYY